jgi:membrane protease YdiL (CAAX protease family)
MMSPQRVLLVALATQGGLIALAWWGSRALALPPRWGSPARDVIVGLVAAVALALANYLLLTRAPSNWIVDGVRAVYRETLQPLFGGLRPLAVVLIGAAAGVGEEWLFRGIVLPLAGLLASSVLFGIAHVGGRRMLPFGVWATGMGVVMGGLAGVTGGLIAPIVAHAVYDMLALEYIRRGVQQE